MDHNFLWQGATALEVIARYNGSVLSVARCHSFCGKNLSFKQSYIKLWCSECNQYTESTLYSPSYSLIETHIACNAIFNQWHFSGSHTSSMHHPLLDVSWASGFTIGKGMAPLIHIRSPPPNMSHPDELTERIELKYRRAWLYMPSEIGTVGPWAQAVYPANHCCITIVRIPLPWHIRLEPTEGN